jgi:hypothetical protein
VIEVAPVDLSTIEVEKKGKEAKEGEEGEIMTPEAQTKEEKPLEKIRVKEDKK